MSDKSKVLDALQNCMFSPKCRDCPWEECEYEHEVINSVPYSLIRDAVSIIKEQCEAVKPEYGGDMEGEQIRERKYPECGTWWYECGNCRTPIDWKDRFCRHCGRPLKWE